MYFENMIKELNKDNSYSNKLLHIINPFSPYFMCDHFIGDEIHKYNIPISNNKNDILKSNNLLLIKDYDIIYVQVNYFEKFNNEILEKINNKIILMTGQWHLPQINSSNLTEKLLNYSNIILWISQNPIYPNNKKYIAFPYGISHENLNTYGDIIKKNSIKTKNISYLPVTRWTNKTREKLPDLPHISLYEYYNKILESKYIISPIGDRDDCYRHYEAIGLGAIPIANINYLYKNIFGNNIIYKNIDDILNIIETNRIEHNYIEPNKDLICFFFYRDKILKYIKKIKKEKYKIFKNHFHKTRKLHI
jgi:hypothetical protein